MKGKKGRLRRISTLTAFEKDVYSAVMEIPLGQTRSYQWVACRIGCPGGARAVGNALNKNPFAPYVPCHRVIASDGSSGGYSAGIAKKNALLRRERLFMEYAVCAGRKPKTANRKEGL